MEFGESNVLVLDKKSNMTSKYDTTFLLLYAIRNEKTVKLMPIDGMPAASKTHLAETRSNNSGRYTLIT